jgi:hypothetical protein
MNKWLKAPLVWVTAILTISYVVWVIVIFKLRYPLGFPVSIESIGSVDELAALATLPLGFFSVMAIGFAIYAVLLQKENHDETKKQFRKEFNLMLAAPVQDKYDQVLYLIESTRLEFEGAKLSHLKSVQKAREVLSEKIRANPGGVFALKDPLHYENRLPDRIFLSAMTYEDVNDPGSDYVHQTWDVNRAYKIIEELSGARRLANRIYHHERVAHIIQRGIDQLHKCNVEINTKLKAYLAILNDNVDTGDSAIGIVDDAFDHCREIAGKVKKYTRMFEQINTKDFNELRGIDHRLYLMVKRASDNLKKYPEQYFPAPSQVMSFKRNAKLKASLARNYDELQDSYDRMLKFIFKKVSESYPEISAHCDPQIGDALLDVFRPGGATDPRRILVNLYSPFIQSDIPDAIRKVKANLKTSG